MQALYKGSNDKARVSIVVPWNKRQPNKVWKKFRSSSSPFFDARYYQKTLLSRRICLSIIKTLFIRETLQDSVALSVDFPRPGYFSLAKNGNASLSTDQDSCHCAQVFLGVVKSHSFLDKREARQNLLVGRVFEASYSTRIYWMKTFFLPIMPWARIHINQEPRSQLRLSSRVSLLMIGHIQYLMMERLVTIQDASSSCLG
jgi:hypothetical protein